MTWVAVLFYETLGWASAGLYGYKIGVGDNSIGFDEYDPHGPYWAVIDCVCSYSIILAFSPKSGAHMFSISGLCSTLG